jgi:uncharacterized membrane protein
MFITELFASILFAVMASLLSLYLLRRSGYKMAFSWLFLLMLLATWAGGLWISPVGPAVEGVVWLPFAIAGVLVVLFLLAFMRPRRPHGRKDTIELLEREKQNKDLQKITTISLNLFFYFLLFLLLAAIILRYATRHVSA